MEALAIRDAGSEFTAFSRQVRVARDARAFISIARRDGHVSPLAAQYADELIIARHAARVRGLDEAVITATEDRDEQVTQALLLQGHRAEASRLVGRRMADVVEVIASDPSLQDPGIDIETRFALGVEALRACAPTQTPPQEVDL